MEWLTLPPLNSLKAFAAVAEHRSYTRAGLALNVTHAAVMQQVRTLESHIGQSLVTRAGRGVVLTSEGQALAQDLSTAFSLMHRGVERLSRASRTRPVQVTTSPAFALKWLMPRLGAFHQKHPDVTLMLNPTGEIVPLEQSQIDLAIRYSFHTNLPTNAELLLETDLVVVAAPSLLDGRTVRAPADLLHYPWLQELGTNEVADWFRRQGVTIDRPPMISHMPGNLIMESITRGDGVTYTCRQWIERELETGELVELFSDDRCGVFHIVSAHPSPREPVRRFIGWLRSQAD